MKSPDSTYHLIQALSKQEKWYFKVYADWNSIKGDNNYIRLFDLMDAQKEYDEHKLKMKIGKQPLAKNFAETKYQLHSLILKSLHAFHLNSSVDNRLKTLTHQIEILFSKALYDEALRLIYRAKKIARDYEKLIPLLDILEWERMTAVYSCEQEEMEQLLENIRKEKLQISNMLKNLNDYYELGDRLFVLHQRSGVVRDKKILQAYKSIMNHPLLKDVGKAMTHEAKVWFYQCHKYFSFAMQDEQNYYRYSQLHTQALEEKPHCIEEKMTRYIGSLYTLAMAQSDMGYHDEFIRTIEKMRSIPKKFKAGRMELNRLKIFEQSYRQELNYYNHSGQFTKGNAISGEVLNGIERYRNLLTGFSCLLFYYELARIKFGAKRYDEALDFINRAINQPETGTREDIVAVMRILQLIIHFELGNNLLLPYIIKSTYRFLYRKNRLYKMETMILQYLRKLERIRTQRELINSFRVLRNELSQLSKDPYEKIGLDYFDFISWLDSKIEKKDFEKVVAKKFKRQFIW